MDKEKLEEKFKIFDREGSQYQIMRNYLIGKYGITVHDAEDYVSEGIYKAFVRLSYDSLLDDRKLKAYIFTCVKRVAIDKFRKSTKEREVHPGFHEDLEDPYKIYQRKCFEQMKELVLKHIYECIPNDLDKLIYIYNMIEGMQPRKIRQELLKRGIDKTTEYISSRILRIKENAGKVVREKFPNFKYEKYP